MWLKPAAYLVVVVVVWGAVIKIWGACHFKRALAIAKVFPFKSIDWLIRCPTGLHATQARGRVTHLVAIFKFYGFLAFWAKCGLRFNWIADAEQIMLAKWLLEVVAGLFIGKAN